MSTTDRNAFVQTFAKVVLIVSAASHPRSAAVHFLALEWFLALSEVCEMPEALHLTHGSEVG